MKSAPIPNRLPRWCRSFAWAASDAFAVAGGKCIDWSKISVIVCP